MSPLTPAVSAEKLEAFGYAIAIYPGACLASIIPALTEDMRSLKESGVQKSPDNIIESFIALNNFLKNDVYSEWEKKYT